MGGSGPGALLRRGFRRRVSEDGSLLDLTFRDEAANDYAATIVSALNPDEYEISIAEALA